jgi:hypothetical protein
MAEYPEIGSVWRFNRIAQASYRGEVIVESVCDSFVTCKLPEAPGGKRRTFPASYWTWKLVGSE